MRTDEIKESHIKRKSSVTKWYFFRFFFYFQLYFILLFLVFLFPSLLSLSSLPFLPTSMSVRLYNSFLLVSCTGTTFLCLLSLVAFMCTFYFTLCCIFLLLRFLLFYFYSFFSRIFSSCYFLVSLSLLYIALCFDVTHPLSLQLQ